MYLAILSKMRVVFVLERNGHRSRPILDTPSCRSLVPTTTTYPASYSRRGHARHRALPASACALRDWGLSAAPPRDAGRMLPCAAYSHAYICHSNINSCAYAYAYHWAVATATAMAIPGGRARGRGGASTQRGVEEAGKPDHTAS